MKTDNPNLMRTCSKCKTSKPADLDHFYSRKTGHAGLSAWCKPCQSQHDREYRVKRVAALAAPPGTVRTCSKCGGSYPATTEHFTPSPYCQFGLAKTCKSCRKEYKRAAPPRRPGLAHHLKYAYGMSLEEYERLKAAQDSKCAICGDADSPLQVDHCHSSGQVRGLLCGSCNRAIGIVRESVEVLRSMIGYLELHRSPQS